MTSSSTFYSRWSRLIVLLSVAALPLLVYGVRGALRGGNNDVRQWLPEGFRETRQYDWFLEHFGSEEMAVVSWPGATLEDERLDRVADGVRKYVDPATEESLQATVSGEGLTSSSAVASQPLFKRVLTTREVLAELTAEPISLSDSQAAERLRGVLLGPDGQTSALIVMVNETGAANRRQALDVVHQVAAEEAGLSRDDLRMGGPTVDSVALDSESERSRYLLTTISVLVALLLAWRCLRHIRLVLMVFATAILAAMTSMAVVHFTGGTMNLLLVMMPTLIYVLTISGGVHLANYYRDSAAAGSLADAPLKAVKAAGLPCALSAATTAIGLGSLYLSEVIPVKMFGLYSALGVLAGLPLLLLVLPAALQLWPLRGEATARTPGLGTSRIRAALLRQNERAPQWLSRHHRWIAIAGVGLMFTIGAGVLRLETSVKLLNLFSPQAKIIQDYTWLEQHLGPLVPVEVVLRLDDTNSLTMLERMQLVGEVEGELNAIDRVGGVTSAATFAPELPSASGSSARQVARRRVAERKLEGSRDYFSQVHYLREIEEGELWRVSARVEALNSVDYGHFIGRLEEQVEPVLQQWSELAGSPIEATYTGIVPLVYKAQRALLNDLTTSFVTAFLIIGGVMIVMLRSVPAGLVSMLPNIFPAMVMFGGMGWAGMLCDIGSMMTAGVALGIAVDDTIHYLSWFKRGLAQGLSRREAIALAYERCSGAMLQTTLICGLGLLVFAFSSFIPTSRFAWLMASMLGTGLIGDLILLPALLAGPLGKFFERSAASEREAQWEAPAEAIPQELSLEGA